MVDEFSTQDIVLAATLKVLGYQMKQIISHNNRGSFIFSDVQSAMLVEYDLGNVRVEPVAFNQAIRTLTTAARRSY